MNAWFEMGVGFAVAILNRKLLFKRFGRMTELVNTCYKLMKPKSVLLSQSLIYYFILFLINFK